MMRFQIVAIGLYLLVVLDGSVAARAEVLGHISDDTETTATVPNQNAEPRRERQIIYRVICNPQGEQLPDCDQPVNDVESVEGEKPVEDLTPSFPPDPEDAAPIALNARPPVASQSKPSTSIAAKAPAGKNNKMVLGKSKKTARKITASDKSGGSKVQSAKKAERLTKNLKTSNNRKSAKKTKK